MNKKLITILVVTAVILALVCAAAIGFVWYRNTHVFLEGDVYPIDAQNIDLRDRETTFAYFDSLQLKLPECEILWNVPLQGGSFSNDSTTLALTDLTEADIAILIKYFPKLTTVDASGCQNYAVLESLKTQMPELTVSYSVTLGSKSVAPTATGLVLENGDFDLAILKENLKHLPTVYSIQLKNTTLTLEEIQDLQAAWPNIAVSYTVEILGHVYDSHTTELDLSAMTAGDIPAVCDKFPMLPNLAKVELSTADGTSQLTKEDVKTLIAAAPGISFHYAFQFAGQTLSTDTESVHIKNKTLNEDELRLALDLMPGCKRIVLENCGLSNDCLAKIRDDYRHQTKVVWRVWFGGGTTLTDVEVIRSTYDLINENCGNLIYCEDVRFMDIGHNEALSTVSFVAGMPNLEVIIISGAPIRDLSPFANCKNLRVLEAAFCGLIEDISPLASCEKLEMLNISFTKVKDLTALDNLPMTHLVVKWPNGIVPMKERDRFVAQHPDCLALFTGSQPYGLGWRYDDNNDPLPWYAEIREVFHYPHAPNNEGWYLPKDE